MGRRKMNMEATFSKRRKGLFREAANVSASSGSEMAVIVLSSDNKPYVFGNPSADSHKPNKHAGVDELKKYKAYVEGIKKRVEGKMDSLGIKLDNSSDIGYAREERDQ
ncbi:uncharacterized protein Pyn_20902 [Prunus yedoensis var. nudiflora]|uniref:MADS-box domain-containing protein n=1 Tax=Prunus yedoensis var. nudiflora TaxID=2094558 RepID=A0A314YUC5_PRUYE|nr:uncharacterized protein Pyn_20902 [Prunus yedoensis var. nudiflora]